MPRLLQKRPAKPDPTKVYVCFNPFSTNGQTVSTGDRLRGDHPLLQTHLGCFYVDGTPSDEAPTVYSDMAAAAARTQPDVDIALLHAPKEYEPATLAIATAKRPLRVAVGLTGDGLPERIVTIRKGARLLSNEPLVRERPDDFEIERVTA